jgi:hypothetical protein
MVDNGLLPIRLLDFAWSRSRRDAEDIVVRRVDGHLDGFAYRRTQARKRMRSLLSLAEDSMSVFGVSGEEKLWCDIDG